VRVSRAGLRAGTCGGVSRGAACRGPEDNSQIGLPPKRAAKLVRFDHAAHRLAAGEGAARVAADGGYADQSHLHRDVVAFTSATPATLAGEPWLAVDDTAWPDRGPQLRS